MNTKFLLFIIIFLFLLNAMPDKVFPQTGWISQNINITGHSLNSVYAVSNNNVFIGGGYIASVMPYLSYYIYCNTTNAGANWITMTTGYGYYVKSIQFINSQTGYAGAGSYEFTTLEDTYGQHILKTTNGGLNWLFKYTITVTPGFNMDITDIHFIDENTGWASSRNGSVLRTTNAGQNWNIYYTSQYSRKNGVFFNNANTGYVCGDTGAVFITTNGGVNWTKQVVPTVQHLKSILFINPNTGWATGNGGTIIRTTNGGTNWNNILPVTGQNLNYITFISPSKGWIAGNNIILGTSSGGAVWESQFSGTASLTSISFSDSVHGYACGGNMVYATVTGGWTSVHKTGINAPGKFCLNNNYPNPFNLSTVIKFDVPRTEFINLVIFDINGREIQTLVNEKLRQGSYQIDFRGDEINSGVYFYRMTAGNYAETRKMVFIK